jgi:PrtD family type I secretion system ABC transporter
MLDRFRDRWLGHQQRIRQLATDLGNQAALLGSASRYSRLLLQSGILGVGAWLVLHGQLTAGGMIAASILLGRALSPFELLIAHWGSIAKTKESALRLSALLTLRPPLTPHVILPRPSGKISVANLVIGPPGHRTPTVRNLSLEVEPGTLVGIVGPSGSGKSTVGRALLGVWQPLSGAVRIDGAAIHQLDREDIGRWLGYLPQDVELFDGTIAENIARFGNLDSAKIIEAAQKSGVHEMILRMPKGYETPIGSGGTVLSGGQRQRIGLARAVFGDPSLIVLDEPNSSLDEAGDEALITALKKLKAEQRTVFVISHRVNVLRLVDQIIVLDAGNLKLVGSRDHVLKAAQEARALSNAVGA